MIGIASIFRTIQGEGQLLGVLMTFVRTAGCSVGCKLCDTDYRMRRRMSVRDIVIECKHSQGDGWIWVTGGEPTDWPELTALASELKAAGFKTAIATAGVREVSRDLWDFISVSPHDPSKWVQCHGDQLNIVPGLNGFKLDDFVSIQHQFDHKYITPCDGQPESVQQCVDFVLANPDWRLGIQAHKIWALP